MSAVERAFIAVAGFGTRMLPITKAVEKCMLPVGTRPVIDYVVEDCIAAGVRDITFVISGQSEQLKTYYGHNLQLEAYLKERNKQELLDAVTTLGKGVSFHYVTQALRREAPYGTAVPVGLCAKAQGVGAAEQVLVAMGDDFVYNQDGSSEIARLFAATAKSGATAGLLATEVASELVSRYGIIQANKDGFFEQIVNCPAPDAAPSRLANISKYVFDKKLFDCVDDVLARPPASNGEYLLTEALNLYVEAGGRIAVVPAVGEYLDGGSEEGLCKAILRVVGAKYGLA